MTTLQQAEAIETAVRNASEVTIDLVQSDYRYVDIVVNNTVLRCKEYRGELFVSGPALVNFSMPIPQWYVTALAGGAYESEASKAAWKRDAEIRAVEIAANRDPEGLDAETLRG